MFLEKKDLSWQEKCMLESFTTASEIDRMYEVGGVSSQVYRLP